MAEYIELPVNEIVARYAKRESACTLGQAYGVGETTIRRRLRAAGVKMRFGAPLGNKNNRPPGGPLHDVSAGYLSTYDRAGKGCLIHRGCWEAHYGLIPDGHIVHHVDEDRQHNAIDNLACMTRGEHKRLHCGQGVV